ncbi:MAG: hypothetical protein JWO36_6473 [Myxococcales bacterium]|nr:hypothetical protein [Myxococcales bacterium]
MMEHTPLEVVQLSPAAQKALGAGPSRMMAARGLLPLPPAEQLAVLYQLAIDAESGIAQSARTTAAGLPEKLLAGTLSDPKIDPRVLDLFAQLIANKPAALDALISNSATSDATMATIVARVGAREVDLIANNEQRLLRHPEIISAMYLNKQARMSTVDRVVELAVRNNVRVPGLAAWDEIAEALKGGPVVASPEVDQAFAAAAAAANRDDTILTTGDVDAAPENEEQPEDPKATAKVTIDKLSIPAKIRLATLGTAFERAELIRDPIRMVSMSAIKSPAVTEFEAKNYASNRNLPKEIIQYIAGKREWTKTYGVKVALCRNPKTPLPAATQMMQAFREKDLVNLTKSKGVSSALVAIARRMLMQRRGGSGK